MWKMFSIFMAVSKPSVNIVFVVVLIFMMNGCGGSTTSTQKADRCVYDNIPSACGELLIFIYGDNWSKLSASIEKNNGLVMEKNIELNMVRIVFSSEDVGTIKTQIESLPFIKYILYNHIVVHD